MTEQQVREKLARVPQVELAHLPTPIDAMPRLSKLLGGPALFVKRDDCTGLGLGGNKVRKLEFLLADAWSKGADVVVSGGVVQSNHIRQTAAACAKLGIDCHLAVMNGRVAAVDADYGDTGNIFLDRLFGARLESVDWRSARNAVLDNLAERLRREDRKPYIVPYGGSNALGALGYVRCALEILDQMKQQDLHFGYIVHASGSAGTQAGLAAAMSVLAPEIKVIGIDIDAEPERVRRDVTRLYIGVLVFLGIDGNSPEADIEVVAGYAGPGYGVATPGMVEALREAARLEGLVLDPVYSGKGLAGLLGLIRAGRFGPSEQVLFLHTGGTPALFAYRSAFNDG